MHIFYLLLFPIISCLAQTKLKPVTTFLNAKWHETPLLLEAAEYMSDENSATFWSFIEDVNSKNLIEYSKGTDKEKFETVLDIAATFLTSSQIKLLKFSLSLRVYSPKIEAFHQIALDAGISNFTNCDIAIDLCGKILCSTEALEKYLNEEVGSSCSNVYSIDHQYPGGESNKVVAILYGEIGTPEFKNFHNELKKLSNSGTLNYILRPYKKVPVQRKVRLSGYGVELQIKSTEYKAQDDTKLQEESDSGGPEDEGEQEVEGFIFSKLKNLYPENEEQLNKLKSHLTESANEMAPLKVWQLQHLSMQAAQRIMTSAHDEMLSIFTHTAQNFPGLARSLTRTKVEEKMKSEIIKNQNTLRAQIEIAPTDAALFINGMQFDLDFTDIYTLLDHVKNEQRVMEGLFKLGIKGDIASTLLNLDFSEAKTEYGIDIRDSAVIWMNNIETDKAYRKWPASISELLRPMYPGMLRSIRKNLHNLVIIGDPSKKETIDIFKMIDGFLSHVSPLRFGIVFAVNSDKKVTGFQNTGVALLCAFNYVVQSYEDQEDANYKGLKFLIDFYSTTEGEIKPSQITDFFASRFKSEDLEDIFGYDSDFDVGRQLAGIFVDKGGFKSLPQALMNGIPLPEKQLASDEFEEMILMEVMKNTQVIQRAVYTGEMDDNRDVVDWLMSLPNIMPRLNIRILSSKSSKFIDMAGSYESTISSITAEKFATLTASEMTSLIGNSCRYIVYKVNSTLRPLTVFIAGDYETEQGRKLLLEAVKYTRESNGIRVCALSNSEKPGVFSRAVEIAQATLSPPVVRQFLIKILDPVNAAKITAGTKELNDFFVAGMEPDAFKSRMSSFQEKNLHIHSIYCSKVLGLSAGKTTVVANGRMLGTFGLNETFSDEDFALLERFFLASFGDKISSIFQVNHEEDASDLIMKVSGVLQAKSQSKSRQVIPIKSDQFSVIKLPAKDPSVPAFDLLAVCDPVSAAAQKIGPILQVLHEVLNANVRIVLNAVEKNSEMPLKSFYRYVLEPEPTFTDSGELSGGPIAKFVGLPESPILTQNYHVPENWLVEVVKSLHDLDNIKLENVESGVHSEFELEHLLLEGHCFEQSTGNPPRGLQFTLGTKQMPLMFDTIVMANLGYFQLKANPGAMVLRLREGRSFDIYYMVSHEGTDVSTASEDVMVVIHSFRSHLVKVKVAKKPDKQHLDLLVDEDEDSGGLWDSISSISVIGAFVEEWKRLLNFLYPTGRNLWLSTFSQSVAKDESNEDKHINIFSVASGHLYERFLRIMMVSVRKHSSKPVKFWFLKNFLSPNIKDSLPLLAKEFDFEYELVQYKWPRWLHQQNEKQRIIWGYKILFLDVLFPLDIKKIIFVDADQVVRADLKQLADLDLEGASYGFVPFCDSRKEMEGFRFWKQGYWRNHLAGRKYHISALFVVDLKKFRRIAAGDRLRGQYQGLSQDPNSLSNLDQDLPNNMVHQVRIKSLPMEWLWCETWCDEDSKGSAKVIDLCNNPLTKEAKLDAAHRIIDEWTEYDNSIKKVLQSSISESKKDKNESNGHSTHSEL